MTPEANELLSESLSGSTRSDRRLVLVYSTICLLIAYTGIIPDEPSVLGFIFPGLTETIIYWGLFALALFTYVCFVTRLASDYQRYRFLKDKVEQRSASDLHDAMYTTPEEVAYQEHDKEEFERDTGYKPFAVSDSSVKRLASFRLLLDCWVPLSYGAVALLIFALMRLL